MKCRKESTHFCLATDSDFTVAICQCVKLYKQPVWSLMDRFRGQAIYIRPPWNVFRKWDSMGCGLVLTCQLLT